MTSGNKTEPRAMNLAQFENEYETGAFVLDFRPGMEFKDAFIPGAFYISDPFVRSGLCREIIEKEERLILVSPEPAEGKNINTLTVEGYEQIPGWLKGGFETWRSSGNKLDIIISIEPDELMLDMKFDNPQVIDIRSEEAYNALHLEDAENIPPTNLLFNLEELPRNETFYLYCDDGELSLSVISCLKSQGFHNFYHISGGFKSLMQHEANMV